MIKFLKASLFALAILSAGPARACEVCDNKLVLLPKHVGCFKARISHFVSEAEEVDPYLVNFVTCNTREPYPDGFAPKGTTVPPVKPGAEVQKLRDTSTLPEGYKPFAFLSFDQLICLSGQLDQLTERPDSKTNFSFSDC